MSRTKTIHPRDRLIVALDLPMWPKPKRWWQLGDSVSFYKIGYQLAFAGGLELCRDLSRARKNRFSSI